MLVTRLFFKARLYVKAFHSGARKKKESIFSKFFFLAFSTLYNIIILDLKIFLSGTILC